LTALRILINQTKGGDGVWGMKQDKALLDMLSKINKGEGNPMWGKKHTEESRQKMGVNKGRKFNISNEERIRIKEVKKTNKEIKELKELLTKNPTAITTIELLNKEKYFKSIKKERTKRYERVKARRNPQTVENKTI
jgi:hypothetical protein